MSALDLLAWAVIAGVLVICVGAVVLSASEAGRGVGRRIARNRARPGYLPITGPAGRSSDPVHRRRTHPAPEEERRLERAAARPRRRG